MRIPALAFAILALFTSAFPAAAIDKPLQMDQAFKATIERTGDGRVIIRWSIQDGYYLYRDYLDAKDDSGNTLQLQTARGEAKDDPTFGSTEIYYGSATATVLAAPNQFRITYQGCQDKGLCYPPTTKLVDTKALTVSDEGLFSAGKFSAAQTSSAQAAVTPAEPIFQFADDHAQSRIDRLLNDGGLLLLAGFLGFGILLAFTPCVFPMYPIVAAMLARKGEQLTARRGFVLSASYVMALAAAFGLLGMAAAWSGQNLQMALQSTYAIGTIAVLFVVLALANFGIFNLQMPAAISSRFGRSNQGWSVPGAMLLGFSSAFLIGPCVTAPLAGALLYIARTGDVVFGASALFALGLGKGIPLIIMATAGGKILPRAGAWMDAIRQFFGFAFLATALWLATPLFTDQIVLFGWAVLALAFGILTFLMARKTEALGMNVLSGTVALISIIWASMLLVGIGAGATNPLAPLAPFRASASTASHGEITKDDFQKVSSVTDLSDNLKHLSNGGSTLLYVTADWCVTCRTIERSILTSPDVVNALNGANLMRLDLTDMDAEKQKLLATMKVVGPPTLVFLNQERREPPKTRLIGEFSASDLTEAALTAKSFR